MESEFIAQLLDLGITGLFISWLAWSNKRQEKRLDDWVDRMLNTLSELEDKREEGYEQIRDRYDTVIAKYDTERDKLLLEIGTKLDHIQDKVSQ